MDRMAGVCTHIHLSQLLFAFSGLLPAQDFDNGRKCACANVHDTHMPTFALCLSKCVFECVCVCVCVSVSVCVCLSECVCV